MFVFFQPYSFINFNLPEYILSPQRYMKTQQNLQ